MKPEDGLIAPHVPLTREGRQALNYELWAMEAQARAQQCEDLLREAQTRLAATRTALLWIAKNSDPALPTWAKDIAAKGLEDSETPSRVKL